MNTSNSNKSFWLSVNNEKPTQIRTSVTNARQAIAGVLDEKLSNCYYVLYNGRVVHEEDDLASAETLLPYYVIPRILGGKGGFGSMLRALGAQIEKTTNREACRDLSGRRMRDVNNEKRLREWVANSGERDRAKEERRKERRERMKAPVKAFIDKEFTDLIEQNREKLDKDMEKGLLAKRSEEEKAKKRGTKRMAGELDVQCKKSRGWLGLGVDVDLDSDDSSSSVSSDVETNDDTDRVIAAVLETKEEVVDSNDATFETAVPSTSYDNSQKTDRFADIEPSCSVEDDGPVLKIEDCGSVAELEQLGLDALKTYLMSRGVKCGGTLLERAQRAFVVKDLDSADIPASLRAKPEKKK